MADSAGHRAPGVVDERAVPAVVEQTATGVVVDDAAAAVLVVDAADSWHFYFELLASSWLYMAAAFRLFEPAAYAKLPSS